MSFGPALNQSRDRRAYRASDAAQESADLRTATHSCTNPCRSQRFIGCSFQPREADWNCRLPKNAAQEGRLRRAPRLFRPVGIRPHGAQHNMRRHGPISSGAKNLGQRFDAPVRRRWAGRRREPGRTWWESDITDGAAQTLAHSHSTANSASSQCGQNLRLLSRISIELKRGSSVAMNTSKPPLT